LVRFLVSTLLYLGANAVALWLADMVLDDMTISGSAFITAVLLFTLVEVLVQPMFTQMAAKGASALSGGTALIATFVGLLVTALINEGFTINGVLTWVYATVIVWVGALLAGWILGLIFVKRVVDDNNR
jgi:putative membrane protein